MTTDQTTIQQRYVRARQLDVAIWHYDQARAAYRTATTTSTTTYSWSDIARCGHNSCQHECKFFPTTTTEGK